MVMATTTNFTGYMGGIFRVVVVVWDLAYECGLLQVVLVLLVSSWMLAY